MVQHLEEVAREVGVGDRVALRPNCRFDEVREAYRTHDLFIMASYRESASVAQVEAMAHGLPVVCCRDNGSAHYVAPGVNGVHVEPSVESLEAGLAFFLARPERLEEFGRNSVRLLEGPLSVGRAYASLMELVTGTGLRRDQPGSPAAMSRPTVA
jgi:1,2-diacylglycerol 3-alpha-glucosyltransferase